MIHGRRATLSRVDAAVARAARAGGLDERVPPHRLRHTRATQAINRGMSLEAIAALLGHRSLTMTLVYARIANHTVRDQAAPQPCPRVRDARRITCPSGYAAEWRQCVTVGVPLAGWDNY